MASSSDGRTNGEGKMVRAGEVVVTANPWVAVVHWNKRSEVCAFCWKTKADLKACNGCHFCYYCDTVCQREDWRKELKYECQTLQVIVEKTGDRRFNPEVSQGPCDYYNLVLKALNRYAITISPAYFRAEMLARVERRHFHRYRAGLAQIPYVECSCDLCTDVPEADANPIKCVTRSCMEPIPSDERAPLACPQCGAMNGSRLAEAKAQLEVSSAKILLVTEFINDSMEEVYWWGKQATLLLELDEPRVVLHPHNVIKLSLLRRTLTTLVGEEMLKRNIRAGLEIKYCDDLVGARSVYRSYYYENNQHYGKLLMACGALGSQQFWALRDNHHAAGRDDEGERAYQQALRFLALSLRGTDYGKIRGQTTMGDAVLR